MASTPSGKSKALETFKLNFRGNRLNVSGAFSSPSVASPPAKRLLSHQPYTKDAVYLSDYYSSDTDVESESEIVNSGPNTVNNPDDDLDKPQETICPLHCGTQCFPALGLMLHLQRKHPDHPDGLLSARAIAKKYGIRALTDGQIAGRKRRAKNAARKKKMFAAAAAASSPPEENKENVPTRMIRIKYKAKPAISCKTATESKTTTESKVHDTDDDDLDGDHTDDDNHDHTYDDNSYHTARRQEVLCPLRCSEMTFPALGLILHMQKKHPEHEDARKTQREIAAKYGIPARTGNQLAGLAKRRATLARKKADSAAAAAGARKKAAKQNQKRKRDRRGEGDRRVDGDDGDGMKSCVVCRRRVIWGHRALCRVCQDDQVSRVEAAETLVMMSRGKW